jgi:hypothetical protein
MTEIGNLQSGGSSEILPIEGTLGYCDPLIDCTSNKRYSQMKGGVSWRRKGIAIRGLKGGLYQVGRTASYSAEYPLSLSRNASASSGILKVPKMRFPYCSKGSRHWEICFQNGVSSLKTAKA